MLNAMGLLYMLPSLLIFVFARQYLIKGTMAGAMAGNRLEAKTDSMNDRKRIQTVMVGCGAMARGHLSAMLAQQDTTNVRVVCEPAPAAYQALCDIFQARGQTPPPNEPDLDQLLQRYGSELDAAVIVTPHVYHHAQTNACLNAGLDVLLEKPMVINAEQAKDLIDTCDQTGKLLVVAFPGSLSPQIRAAVAMLRNNELGAILTISGMAWENWRTPNIGTWRQIPEVAGGGFFFDTGAHMLNTIADLAGEDFVEGRGLARQSWRAGGYSRRGFGTAAFRRHGYVQRLRRYLYAFHIRYPRLLRGRHSFHRHLGQISEPARTGSSGAGAGLDASFRRSLATVSRCTQRRHPESLPARSQGCAWHICGMQSKHLRSAMEFLSRSTVDDEDPQLYAARLCQFEPTAYTTGIDQRQYRARHFGARLCIALPYLASLLPPLIVATIGQSMMR